MARFVYEAKRTPQDVVKGVLAADNRSAALQKIAQMGYYIISLDEETADRFIEKYPERYALETFSRTQNMELVHN